VPGLGSPGQGRGWLSYNTQGIVLTLTTFRNNKKAIIGAGFGGAVIAARSGEANTNLAPALPGASFASFRLPAMNDSLDNTFYAKMMVGPGGARRTMPGAFSQTRRPLVAMPLRTR